MAAAAYHLHISVTTTHSLNVDLDTIYLKLSSRGSFRRFQAVSCGEGVRGARVESQKKRWRVYLGTLCSVIWPLLNVRGSGAMVARDTPNVEVPGSSPGCR